MSVLKLAPALLLSAMFFSPAAAAPVGPNTMGALPDSLVIQARDGGHGGKGHGGGKGHHGGKGHQGKGHGNHGNRHHGGRHHGGNNHGHWNRGGGHWHGGNRWVAGRTYYVAPPGWRQYGARPGNWQTLGCVVVNGFWFCP